MISRAVRKIVEIVGYAKDVDLPELRPGWGKLVRVRISLDISQPLPCGKRVAGGGAGSDFVWVHFKYEHLPQFCYCCGLLGHGDQD